jgi:succinate dehydrogenase / fumarate reductase, cytochrome b subunit
MIDNQNPISPHLQIYRWHISSLLSITHRIAGVINLLALILMFFWILTFSFSENNYELFLQAINSFFGKFILIGFTWSMSFHIFSGIRHLVWDMGYGFEIKTANISGILVIFFSLVTTIIFWLLARGLI